MMHSKMAKSNIKNAMSANDIEWTNKGIKPSFRILFTDFQLRLVKRKFVNSVRILARLFFI